MLVEQLNAMSGVEFENLCASLVAGLGFSVEMTKASGDGGIDIVANNALPLYKGKYIIQCKRYTGTVGEPILRDLYGVVMAEHANKGILMTTGTFTHNATAFAEGKPLELIDIDGILALINQTGITLKETSPTINEQQIHNILELGCYADTFEELLSNYRASPSDPVTMGKLAYELYRQGSDPIWSADYSIDDRRTLIEGCVYYLTPLLRCDLNTIKSSGNAMRVFVLLWLRAQAAFLSSNYSEAQKTYSKLLEWDDLVKGYEKNGLINCLYNLIIDIASFHSTIGQKEMVEKYLTHPVYRHIVALKKTSLENDIARTPNPHQKHYWQRLLDDLANIMTNPAFHPITLQDDNLFDDGFPLYDRATGIYEAGIIQNLLAPDIWRIERQGKNRMVMDDDGELVIALL